MGPEKDSLAGNNSGDVDRKVASSQVDTSSTPVGVSADESLASVQPVPPNPSSNQSVSEQPPSPMVSAVTPQGNTPALQQLNPQAQPSTSSSGVLPSGYTSSPGGGNNKLKVIVLGVVGLIVLVGGLFFALSSFSGLSRVDLQEVYDSTSDVRVSYTKMSTSMLDLINPYSTDNTSTNDRESFEENRKEFNDKLKALGETKAVKKDKELKEKYKAIIDQKPKFDEILDTMIEINDEIVPIIKQVGDWRYDLDNEIKDAKDTKSTLDGMGELKFNINKDFISKLSSDIEAFITAAESHKSNKDDRNARYDLSLSNNYYDARDKITDDLMDFSSDVGKQSKDSKIDTQINDFVKIINKKIAGKAGEK